MTIDLEHAAAVARKAARDAAVVISEIYKTAFRVDYKVGDDPVTEADRTANTLIVAQLRAAFPDVPIVSEEDAPDRAYETARAAWFVDPLDGTRDFVERNGDFCVMIGLAIDGKAALGVINVPLTGEELVGIIGRGAFSEKNGVKSTISASNITLPSEARVLVSRSRGRAAEPFLRAFGPKETLAIGSAGLKAVKVAKGEADAYVQPDRAGCLWDACAPEALVIAAGGRASNIDGEGFDYHLHDLENKRGMVFTNPHLHSRALEALRGVLVEP